MKFRIKDYQFQQTLSPSSDHDNNTIKIMYDYIICNFVSLSLFYFFNLSLKNNLKHNYCHYRF